MGGYTRKMIFRTIILLTFLEVFHCHPQFKLPELDVSTPEEVNSLEQEEPIGRNINNNKKNSIDDTVKEVENIIKSNPALPRLTRGEILDLLENITQRDEQKLKLLNLTRDPKAIMVVMPFTPTNDKNLEDLFTKAPVTHIIGAEPFKPKEETKHSRRRPPVKFNDTDNDLVKKPLVSDEKKKYSASIQEKPTKPTAPRNQVRRRRPELTTPRVETVTTYHPTTEEETSTAASTYHPKTRRPTKPIRRRITTTQHPNHRYPTPDEPIPIQGLRIIEPPKLSSREDLKIEEDLRKEVTIPASASLVTLRPKTTTTKSLTEEFNLPDSLKTVMKDLNLESALDPKQQRIKAIAEEQNRIKSLLASIGAVPETTTVKTTTMPNAESVAESLSPDMRDLLMSFGLLPNPHQNPAVVDIEKFYPEKAEVKPESYIGFKPLPDNGPSRDDMDALLASFGLGRSARKDKSLKDKDEKKLNFDMVPDDLKGVIKNLGLGEAEREEKMIESREGQKVAEKQHIFNPETQHASEEELKKLERLMDMIKQLEKLNGTASEENLKHIDVDGLKELVTSLNGDSNVTFITLDQKESDSPDPNNFDRGIIKNEVKRQESTTASSTTTSTTSSSASSEAETPSITDLEASFGGQSESVTDSPEESQEKHPEVTTKKNGFYYLVDWNTFLDIDDTKGKRVNLRFQPHIGDPKRFLSVTVP